MISLIDLKVYLGVTGTADDALLTAMEVRAVAWVERQTDRYFGPAIEVTETLSGSGLPWLYLREPPAATPAIVIDLDAGSGFVVVDPGDYGLEDTTVYHDTLWPTGYRNIQATYTHGYAPGAEPGDIRQLVMDLVAYIYRRAKRQDQGLTSERIGDYSYALADVGSDDWLVASIPTAGATLDAWRRVYV